MSKLFTVVLMTLTATAAYAIENQVPTPDILPLLGIGVLAVAAAKRFKK